MGDSGGSGLQGRKVALVGRLACMSHPEARRRVAAAAGEVVPPARAEVVVLGEGGGRRDAERLLQPSVERWDEVAFLSALGVVTTGPLYSLGRLAALLKLDPTRLRTWVRQELLQPARVVGRLCLFEFRDVALARRLARLSASGVDASRIRRSLERARRWLPVGDAGPELLEAPAPAGIAVRLEDGRLADPDGQLLMDFEKPVERGPSPALRHDVAPAAEGRFEAAVVAEAEGRFAEAAELYERSVRTGEEPETWFNLGNCRWRLGRREESVAAYRRALALDPEYTEAWNNLGNVLGELGLVVEAVTAYRRALAISPWYADAHYNLAETLSGMGREAEARPHWQAVLQHDPGNPAAAALRQKLGEQR